MPPKRTKATAPGTAKKAKMMSPLDPGTPNAIFSLNDDCLAEVFRFLDIQDVFQIYQIDPRFRDSACLRFSFGGIDRIDPDFIQGCPGDLLIAFLTAFGKTAHSIKLKLLTEDEFLRYISYFKNLQELILSEIRLTEGLKGTNVLPLSLKTLELDRMDIANSILQDWIPKLNPLLTTLRITHKNDNNGQTWNGMESLNNITTLVCDSLLEQHPDIVKSLVSNNKDTLTSLMIIGGGYEIMSEDLWNDIMQSHNLEYLQLSQNGFEGVIPDGTQLFPKLTSFHSDFRGRSLKSVIEALACEETLNSLVVDDYESTHNVLPVSAFKRFRNLRNLELHQGDWSSINNLDDFSQLTQLHTLVLNGGVFDRTREVLEMVPKVSFLRKLMLGNIMFFEKNVDADKLDKKIARICKKYKIECEVGVAEP